MAYSLPVGERNASSILCSKFLTAWSVDLAILKPNCDLGSLVASFEAFTTVMNQDGFFWLVTPCGVVVAYQRFTDPCCLHIQGEVTGIRIRITSQPTVSQSILVLGPSGTRDQILVVVKTIAFLFVVGCQEGLSSMGLVC
jgi:hypothetical protein